MIAGWALLLVSVCYVGLLFALAYYGDKYPLYPSRRWLRPIVYSLALAVYCSSWTFYGAVGSAINGGLAYLPIYLGPLLLFVFGIGLMRKLVLVGKQQNITSIADFIASRYGKSHGLAALVTLIAITAAVPYLALQFKAVAMSISVLSEGSVRMARVPVFRDSAFYIALLLAAFAILFGTRRIDAAEHHHGMMLAIAAESVVKLVAFVAVGIYALSSSGISATIALPLAELQMRGLPSGFFAQTLLAFAATFCLTRQFQVGVVECENPDDLRHARWIFPAYLLLVSLFVLPIVAAGTQAARGAALPADVSVLWLPLAQGKLWLAVLAYVGGFSAATGMVIVASVALSTMVSNDLIMPALLRVRALRLEHRVDLSGVVLAVRRITIFMLALLAYAYYRASTRDQNLASIGLLSFAAVAQFAPAIIGGLYWRGASRIGALTGLLAGFAVWIYTLLLPNLAGAGWLPLDWISAGPFGINWLRPHALFQLQGWDPLTHGTFWSLLANIGAYIFVSLRFRPSVQERLHAAPFLEPDQHRPLASVSEWPGRVRVEDLRAIASRIVGERSVARAFDEYRELSGQSINLHAAADRNLLQFTERLLAGAIGAASARRMLTSALRGSGMDLSEAVALLDEASQELRFNRALLSSTLENIAQGISVVDVEMRLVAWNRRYLEMFGYPDGMVHIGRSVADLIRYNAERGECGAGDIDHHVIKRIDYMRQGSPYVFERVRTDGSIIEMRGRPLPAGGFVTTYTDITAYKHAENGLREANENLEQRVDQRTQELSAALDAQHEAMQQAQVANQSKTRFLAAASHDLLQPLNAARLFTSALRHQPGLDAESSTLAQRIDTAFKAAEDLIESLLEASRLDAGGYQPEISVIALGELFGSIKDQFAVVANARGLHLRVVPTRLHVRSDAQLLRRIVQNFVSNALRYTRAGTVLLGARRDGDNVRIEVWDTGPGVAPEQRAAIFDEFQRGKQASPWGEKGLGLGLAICERMARLLGHTLDLRSWPERGSVFSLRLPLAPFNAASVSHVRKRPETTGFGLTAHVLCIDNDHTILEGMAALLTRWGISCDLAANVDEALAAATLRRPDMILADYHLDENGTGLDALAAIRAHLAAPPPGALITADNSTELKSRARELGYALLRKPVKPAALRALIAQLGRHARTQHTAVG